MFIESEVMFLIIFLVFFRGRKCSFGENGSCGKAREFLLISPDTILADNVVSRYNVTSHDECLFNCYKSKGCQSYNYQYTLHNSGKHGLCEINNKTMHSCPVKKRRKEGHGYFEEVKTVENRMLYGGEENPGLSCLDIKDCQNNDGEYWVSSEQTSWSIVKVFCYMNTADETINLARGKPAVQQSTTKSADRAVDGNRDSHISKNSCTHTMSATSPWWRVDLQNVFFIRKLIITNRSDCCSDRLSNFEIKIGLSLDNSGNSNPSCGITYSLKAETRSIICPQPMIGRYVNIIIPGPEKILTLCEVEVYP